MATTLNVYRQWLELRHERPKTHYQLLGLPLYEGDLVAIKRAANQARIKVERHRGKDHDREVDQLIDELDAAEICLLDSQRKTVYDDKLRERIAKAEAALKAKSSAPAAPAPSKPSPSALSPSAPAPAAREAAEPAPPAGPAVRAAVFHEISSDDQEDDNSEELLPPSATDPSNQSVDLPAPLTPGHFQPTPATPPPAPAGGGYQGYHPTAAAPVPPKAVPPQVVPPQVVPPQVVPPAPAPPQVLPPAPMAAAVPVAGIPVAQAPMGYSQHPTAVAQPVHAPNYGQPTGNPNNGAQIPRAMPVANSLGGSVASAPNAPTAGLPGGGMPVLVQRRFRRRPTNGILIGAGATILGTLLVVLMAVSEWGPFAPETPAVTAQGNPTADNNTSSAANPTTGPKPNLPTGTPAGTTPPRPSLDNRPPTPMPEVPVTPDPMSVPMPQPNRPEPDPVTMPVTMPIPMPVPTPMPEPTPTPVPMPVPMPKPAEPMPNTAAVAAFDHALMSVRYFLGQRDFTEANARLKLAVAAQKQVPERAEDLRRVQLVAEYVEAFWRAAKEGGSRLVPAEQATIAGITVGVVEVGPESITLRQAGQNIVHSYQTMKGGLAVGLAERVLRKGDPAAELMLGAFKLISPPSKPDEAREHWLSAQRAGASEQVAQLLPELEVVVPDGFDPNKVQVASTTPDTMPAGTTPAGTAPTPTPSPTPMPMPVDGKFPIPPAAALDPLIAGLRSSRTAEFSAATTAEAQLLLCDKLQEEAVNVGGDPTARLVLLATARDLAAQAGDFDLAFLIVEHIGETHAVDSLLMRNDVLTEAGKKTDAVDMAQLITEKALELSDEARLLERYTEALLILRNAQTPARKTRDPELLKTVGDRLKEVAEVKRQAS